MNKSDIFDINTSLKGLANIYPQSIKFDTEEKAFYMYRYIYVFFCIIIVIIITISHSYYFEFAVQWERERGKVPIIPAKKIEDYFTPPSLNFYCPRTSNEIRFSPLETISHSLQLQRPMSTWLVLLCCWWWWWWRAQTNKKEKEKKWINECVSLINETFKAALPCQ